MRYPKSGLNRLRLKNVTLWAISWGNDEDLNWRTVRVLNYCDSIIEFGRVVYFNACKKRICDFPFEIIKIPNLDFQRFNVFVNREVPKYITGDFAMSVHEDGFPIDISKWKPDFLRYDYIGAPWHDGGVGNGGFNIESQKLMQTKRGLKVMPNESEAASDTYICRDRRHELENMGIRFAPTSVATQFSTETIFNEKPSFGFHGRSWSTSKYQKAWETLEKHGF